MNKLKEWIGEILLKKIFVCVCYKAFRFFFWLLFAAWRFIESICQSLLHHLHHSVDLRTSEALNVSPGPEPAGLACTSPQISLKSDELSERRPFLSSSPECCMRSLSSSLLLHVHCCSQATLFWQPLLCGGAKCQMFTGTNRLLLWGRRFLILISHSPAFVRLNSSTFSGETTKTFYCMLIL